ncbi:hypothetical protein HYFRA_00011377 [Hymenoscyphus fraxineus]|uniref:Uncharacterized protein n=1 Tax=Hymenoscyphus fraxineus TaxID=746836 RepID=A0A9N9KZF4_9HELO|nr:hypothetical protein HYFRA_00011377 [Hymenoscyphus fraxineus]
MSRVNGNVQRGDMGSSQSHISDGSSPNEEAQNRAEREERAITDRENALQPQGTEPLFWKCVGDPNNGTGHNQESEPWVSSQHRPECDFEGKLQRVTQHPNCPTCERPMQYPWLQTGADHFVSNDDYITENHWWCHGDTNNGTGHYVHKRRQRQDGVPEHPRCDFNGCNRLMNYPPDPNVVGGYTNGGRSYHWR